MKSQGRAWLPPYLGLSLVPAAWPRTRAWALTQLPVCWGIGEVVAQTLTPGGHCSLTHFLTKDKGKRVLVWWCLASDLCWGLGGAPLAAAPKTSTGCSRSGFSSHGFCQTLHTWVRPFCPMQ